MRRHIDMKYPPAIVAQNDQDEKNPKGCGRNREEISSFTSIFITLYSWTRYSPAKEKALPASPE